MIALELVSDGDREKPNAELTQKLIANATDHGLILLACGFYGNVIRFLPALTITDELVEEGLEHFAALFSAVADAS